MDKSQHIIFIIFEVGENEVTSTFKLVLSKGAAVMQPGIQKEPLPMFRSTMIGVRSSRTAYAARICVKVDLP